MFATWTLVAARTALTAWTLVLAWTLITAWTLVSAWRLGCRSTPRKPHKQMPSLAAPLPLKSKGQLTCICAQARMEINTFLPVCVLIHLQCSYWFILTCTTLISSFVLGGTSPAIPRGPHQTTNWFSGCSKNPLYLKWVLLIPQLRRRRPSNLPLKFIKASFQD